ncbi:Fructosamine kinase, partial [Actinacidiphila rubida]
MTAGGRTGPAEDAGAAAARLTGRQVTSVRQLSTALTEAVLDDGRTVMVKRGGEAGAVRAEAAGLRWLAGAGAVPVPLVHGWDERWLVIDLVPRGRPDRRAALAFGSALAALHAAGAPAFGAPPPGGPEHAFVGLAPLRNVPDGTLRPGEAAVVEEVCARLPHLSGPAEPPAR